VIGISIFVAVLVVGCVLRAALRGLPPRGRAMPPSTARAIRLARADIRPALCRRAYQAPAVPPPLLSFDDFDREETR
jgi:hypothetical protein